MKRDIRKLITRKKTTDGRQISQNMSRESFLTDSSCGSDWGWHGIGRRRANTVTIADGARISGGLLSLPLFHHLVDALVVRG